MKNPFHPGRLVLHDCLEPLGLGAESGHSLRRWRFSLRRRCQDLPLRMGWACHAVLRFGKTHDPDCQD